MPVNYMGSAVAADDTAAAAKKAQPKKLLKAKFKYSGDHLEFKAGDILEVLAKADANWVKVQRVTLHLMRADAHIMFSRSVAVLRARVSRLQTMLRTTLRKQLHLNPSVPPRRCPFERIRWFL